MKKAALLLALSAVNLQTFTGSAIVFAHEEKSANPAKPEKPDSDSAKQIESSRFSTLAKPEKPDSPASLSEKTKTNTDADMQEVWQAKSVSWKENRLQLALSYSAKNPVYAAILPLSAQAKLIGKSEVFADEKKVADLVCEEGQAGLIWSKDGLEMLKEGKTIEADLMLEFEGEGPYTLTIGDQKIIGELKESTEISIQKQEDGSSQEEDEQVPFLDADKQDEAFADKTESSSLLDERIESDGNGAQILDGSLTEKIAALQAAFPDRSFWNHRADDFSDDLESVSQYPTDESGYLTNSFEGMNLSHGFSALCYYKTHGVQIQSGGTLHIAGNEGVKAGDVIHIRRQDDDSTLGSYAYVWKIEGDTCFLLEISNLKTGRISNANTADPSDIIDYYTPAESGSCEVKAYAAPSKRASSIRSVQGSALSMPQAEKESPYAKLQGYSVYNCDNGAFLYEDMQGENRWFHTDEQAAAAGFFKRTFKKPNETLYANFPAGMHIALLSDWQTIPYTITIDPNGGHVEKTVLNTFVDEEIELPNENIPTRAGYRLIGFVPYNAQGQRLYQGDDGLYKSFENDEAAKREGYRSVTVETSFCERFTLEENDRITLQALWEKTAYTLNFTNLYDSDISDSKSYAYSEKVVVPKGSMKREGFIFTGWRLRFDGQILCQKTENGKTDDRLFDSLDEAANAGYRQTRIGDGGSFTITWQSPDASDIELVATWKAKTIAQVSMHRLYNPNSGEHFYTASTTERDSLVKLGWKYEGIGWSAPESSNTPVYRLYNPNAGDHHYTLDAKEKDELVRIGWRDEGIGWYSDDEQAIPVYRQYNPNAKAGAHNYSSSMDEHQGLIEKSWKGEGIGWYGLPPKESEQSSIMENAQKIYSFYKTRGNCDAQIAGILANWQTESGIDSTKFESYYKDDYRWTDEKEELLSDISTYTTDYVFPLYKKSGIAINQDAYRGYDGRYYCGIGMFGCTGPAAQVMLETAQKMNASWWDFDWQLAYATSGYRPGAFDRADFLAIETPEEAAVWVLGNYEGCPGHSSSAQRQKRAAEWMERMKEWSVDVSYANSVMQTADEIALLQTRASSNRSVPSAGTSEKAPEQKEFETPDASSPDTEDGAFEETPMDESAQESSMEEMFFE